MTITKHFVTFYSPGTFVAEDDTREIEGWSVQEAVEMARSIKQRHNATPYGFRFTTMERGDGDWKPKEMGQSGMYYLGGQVETIAEIESRNDPSDRILLNNMRGNGWDRVVTNRNSWRWTLPFNDGDTLLDFVP